MNEKELVPTDPLHRYYGRLADLYAKGIPNDVYGSMDVPEATVFDEPNYNVKEIPVDFSLIQRWYVKTFKAGLETPKHEHDSPSFRYVLKGKIKVNDKTFGVGEWVFVPKNVPYTFKALEDAILLDACNHGTHQKVFE